MRFTLPYGLAAVALFACGGGPRDAQQTQPPAAPPAATPAADATPAPAGPVVEIQMTGNGTNKAAFVPNAVTIAPGTTLRFMNVSGGPHNIAFWKDSIPAGAKDGLNAAMPQRTGDLSGPFLTQAHQTYDVVFPAAAPKGVYKGFCAPHVALGMKIAVTVQ